MRTMSLFESEESNGTVSLKQLFDKKEINGTSNLSIEQIAYIICRGGWALSLDLNLDSSLDLAKDYYDAVVKIDINKVDNIKDCNKIRKFMKSYARNQGS